MPLIAQLADVLALYQISPASECQKVKMILIYGNNLQYFTVILNYYCNFVSTYLIIILFFHN